MTRRRGAAQPRLPRLAPAALAAACLLGAAPALQSQIAKPAAAVAAAGGPAWSSLTPAQRTALAPLERDWPGIDASRKQKWLEIAARFPSMPADERRRVQERMAEWAHMTPAERGQARAQFQEARQVSPQSRAARWDAYMALPEDERRALAKSASQVPQTKGAKPANRATTPAVSALPQDRGVGSKSPPVVPKPVAPTVVQARPGATTTLVTKPATPPPHAQAGQPRIAASQDVVNRSTLLPQAGPQGAAAAAQTAATPAAAAPANAAPAAAPAANASGTR